MASAKLLFLSLSSFISNKSIYSKQHEDKIWSSLKSAYLFIFKNVSPVIIILIISLIALHNFGSIFKPVASKEEEEIVEEDVPLPTFDPYLVLQQNKTGTEDFFQQDIQYASVLDKKKSDIINTILGDPEEAARILTSYIKE